MIFIPPLAVPCLSARVFFPVLPIGLDKRRKAISRCGNVKRSIFFQMVCHNCVNSESQEKGHHKKNSELSVAISTRCKGTRKDMSSQRNEERNYLQTLELQFTF